MEDMTRTRTYMGERTGNEHGHGLGFLLARPWEKSPEGPNEFEGPSEVGRITNISAESSSSSSSDWLPSASEPRTTSSLSGTGGDDWTQLNICEMTNLVLEEVGEHEPVV